MIQKKLFKAMLTGVAAMTFTIALPFTVRAVPPDVIEDGVVDNTESAYLFDDSALLESVGENYVATAAANVRSYPNGPIIGKLTPGVSYYVTGRRTDCNWYQITGFSTNAYVFTKYLEKDESAAEAKPKDDFEKLDILMQATANVNMRETPNGKVIGTLPKGTDIHVTGNVNDKSWYQCEYNGTTVYVYDDYLLPDFPQTMSATHDVNVRTAPSNSGTIMGVLNKGERVKVSAEEHGWFRFTFEKTREVGYSYSKFLAAMPD